MSTYGKLLVVQSKLKAPKGQFNDFGGYKYRSCEDIVEAAKPFLEELKCILLMTDDLVQSGDRYYVKAEAHFIDTETGDSIRTTAFAREDLNKKGYDGAQITGAASSYARKYALNGLFAIDDTKDADATNQHGKGNEQPPAPQPVPFVCDECGQVIADYKDANGKRVSAKRHAESSLQQFGKIRCLDCIRRGQEQTVQDIGKRAAEMGVPVNGE